MAGVQGAKAISAVVDGRVSEVEHARVFSVKGSSETYTVVVGARSFASSELDHHDLLVQAGKAGRDVCNCAAGQHGRRCYHVIAAHLQIAQERTAAREREVTA